eukprot:CAMPEP_0179304748 /NCGR_PEP_ID=MMETSP0797-20121207/49264_1 /TAXON_ID=47934 /ORGANISM="Dinophysis acuminata, Strain DAEP01" /LENGTH=36 /DNA_ID= /DNA_START= /DNA_END= /DNA_ORIENTATION=
MTRVEFVPRLTQVTVGGGPVGGGGGAWTCGAGSTGA